MNKEVKNILNDLYKIEPELKKHEIELMRIIEELLISKPDTKFDEQFARELRVQVLARAKELQTETAEPAGASGFLQTILSSRLGFAFGGALIALAVVAPAVILINKQNDLSRTAINNQGIFSEGISKLSNSAFGSLTNLGTADGTVASQESNGALSRHTAIGLGGGAGNAPLAPMEADSKIGVMPLYGQVKYEYKYTGEPVNLPSDELEVYKRVISDTGTKALAGYLSNLDIGLLDLTQFKNTKLTNLNLVEDREFGYSIYLNMQESMLDIWSNWEMWPHPAAQCRDQACYDSLNLGLDDIPDDAKLIEVARKFLGDYQVDLSNYGEPLVQKSWLRQYEGLADQTDLYVPDEITVVFPELVAGQLTYDSSGNPAGLFVGVNIHYNRVANVNSIMPLSYQSSAYPVATDADKIIGLAERGGLYPDYSYGEEPENIIIELGTPKLGLVKYWKYSESDQRGQELLVPGYIFPITNKDSLKQSVPYYYRENIVVPLVKEIFDQVIKDNFERIEPMPMLKSEEMEAMPNEMTSPDNDGVYIEPESIGIPLPEALNINTD